MTRRAQQREKGTEPGERVSERKEKMAPRFETWIVWRKEVPRRRRRGGKASWYGGSISLLLEIR